MSAQTREMDLYGITKKEKERTKLCSSSSVFWTLFFVNLAGVMESADEALLPAVYREIGLTVHASPALLGSLTVLRSIVQVLCFPLASLMSVNHNRSSVIALGAVLWAAATFCIGLSSTFMQIALFRALTGVGLALVIPAIQSMVADVADKDNRGLAFGWLQFTGSLGGMLGNAFAVLLAGTTVFGLAGWRASFYLISALSFVVAFLVFKYAVDPRFAEAAYHPIKEDGIKALSLALKDTLQQAQRVVKIPTFIVIVAQGIAGNFPWAAMSFAPMWLELIGFSHGVTALLVFIFIASNALGGLFGGHMGDVLARQLPNTGRIILAQFSSSVGIPLGSVLLLFLPYNSSAPILYGTLIFIMGFLMSWSATATNNPIFAEIVPENSRTTIYALDGSFETVLSSFAPLVVGLLAEHVFGYVSPNSDGTTAAADTQNASALAKSLFVALVVPFTFCCLIYSILYWTYPKDRDTAQIEAGMTSQLEKVSELSLKAGYVSLKEEANTTRELDEDLFELM